MFRGKIETEYKIELSRDEFSLVRGSLTDFEFRNTEVLEDYFFDIQKFDEKGFDFTRIRIHDSNNYEKTIKKWHLRGGERVREEIESESNSDELESFKSSKKYLSLKKTRTNYKGTVLGYNAILSFDEINFTDEDKYFFECEIDVPEELTNSIRPELKNWMLRTFNLSDRPEGIGMMKLVIQKQTA